MTQSGNFSRDVPACSAVPQPTAPPCATKYMCIYIYVYKLILHKSKGTLQWVPGLSLGKKRPGRGADHSPSSSAVVKKE